MDYYARAYRAYGFYSIALALGIFLIFGTGIACVEYPKYWPVPLLMFAACVFFRWRQRKAKRRMWS